MSDIQTEPREFTDQQLHAALKRVGEQAKKQAFSAGKPIVVLRGTQLVWIYPDGREVTSPVSPGPPPQDHSR